MNFERSSHPKLAQIDALLRFLERNPSLAKGFPKVPSAREAARRHWERMASELNSMEGSAKSWKQWTKYWADKKSAVKKKAAQRSAALRKSDGGTEEVPNLSEVEERIVSLMCGKSCVEGDPLAVHQFSDSQNIMEKDDLTLLASVPLNGEPAANIMMNSFATHCVPPSQSLMPEMSAELSPPAIKEDTVPSRQGTYPRYYTPFLRHLPHRNTTSRRSRSFPNSPASQRRSQLLSTTDRFLRMEEQRLLLEKRNTDVVEGLARIAADQMESLNTTNIAIAQALTSIGDGLKMLAERSPCRCRINGNSDDLNICCPALDSQIKVEPTSRDND